jgi:aminoglycoside 3-N-acetyltransferase
MMLATMSESERTPVVTEGLIAEGLRELGFNPSSVVIVHSSLRSFGYVEGGALAVCRALFAVCGTILVPAGTWDLTHLPAPPGLVRPDNAILTASTWEEFDSALARALPFSQKLPIDRGLGTIAETMRQSFPHHRSPHPLLSYLVVGRHAKALCNAQRLDWPLGPFEAAEALSGEVLLLGVSHTSNTTIHLAEQRLGRSRFFRYAKADEGVWLELPNIPGESHRFDRIESALVAVTREVKIGSCRARRIAISDIVAVTDSLIRLDPAALLCEDSACRCGAALQQRLATIKTASPGVTP